MTKSQTISSFLKVETAHLHKQVENRLSKIIFHRLLSPQTYFAVLSCMHKSYIVMEHELTHYSPTKELLLTRSKLNWLEADINYLKQSHRALNEPTTASVSMNLQSVAQAMGAMYVMEGATLGGAHINQRLRKHDWLGNLEALHFFTSYADLRMQRWQEFTNTLENFYHKSHVANNDIKSGANKAFLCIYNALEYFESE